jgi:uncharacterized membrane protein
MTVWLRYAAVALAVCVAGVAIGHLFVAGAARGAVLLAAGMAWLIQVVAFAALLSVRGRSELFMLGWIIGLVLRFGAVGGVAFWLARNEVVPRTPMLISLVTFIFGLLLLEPLYLRRGLQTR